MSAHTPGPWRWEVAPDGEDGDCILVAGDFTEIILATGVDGTPADDDLIAAAPDLLAALQSSRAQWIHSVNAPACLAAIARATGEAA